MRLKNILFIAIATLFGSQLANAQEGLPIYSDYLTDKTKNPTTRHGIFGFIP